MRRYSSIGQSAVRRTEHWSRGGSGERTPKNRQSGIGYAALLTNDSAYWKVPDDKHTVHADFRLHSGHIHKGTLAWQGAAPGTTRDREDPTRLRGSYSAQWTNC